MKHLKLLTAFLVFLLSLTASSASGKLPESAVHGDKTSAFSTFGKHLEYSFTLLNSKDLDVHYKFKNKVRYRATASESSALDLPYITKPAHLTLFKSRLIYGISVIYHIQRHNYLHLYQLF